MLKGDANLDGIVNEKDVMELRRLIKKIVLPTYYNFKASDMDSNRVLNIKDVDALRQVLTKYIPGDADGDGKLSDHDAAMIRNEVAGLVHLTGRNLKNADYNKDGKVNMQDVVALQRLLEKIKEGSMLKGDANQDGIVDEKDALELNKIITGKIIPTPEQRYAADMDNNGVLNMKDITALKRLLNQYIPGDADGDGQLSDNDVTTMQKDIADRLHLTGRNFQNADCDGNGKISLQDVVDLQRYLAILENREETFYD